MKIKLKPGLLMREVAGEKVLLATGEGHVDFSRMLVLNEPAAMLIKELMNGVAIRIDGLVKLLMEHYEVEYNRVKGDVEDLVSDLGELNMLENI